MILDNKIEVKDIKDDICNIIYNTICKTIYDKIFFNTSFILTLVKLFLITNNS